MGLTFLVILVIVVVVLGYGVMLYNNLVQKRQMSAEGWSGIDVQLKRRADLIPNMLETVKGYMSHERETLQAVTAARTKVMASQTATPQQRGEAESMLSAAIGRLFAVAEDYPELKANTNFLEFQETLQTVEDEIQMSRRYYNGSVRDLNIAVESFPSNLVANGFGFTKAEYFEIDEPADRGTPKVEFNQ